MAVFLVAPLLQEECTARASGMYPCLLLPRQMNITNTIGNCGHSACIQTHMIYSPLVLIFKAVDSAKTR